MSRISEKVSYLEGLVDGIGVKDEKTKKIVDAVIDTLHVIADEIAEHDVCLTDICDAIEEDENDDDFDECDGNCDDCEFSDSCFYEVVCPSCGETIYFDEDMLDSEDGLICPNCNEPVDISIAVQDSEDN